MYTLFSASILNGVLGIIKLDHINTQLWNEFQTLLLPDPDFVPIILFP